MLNKEELQGIRERYYLDVADEDIEKLLSHIEQLEKEDSVATKASQDMIGFQAQEIERLKGINQKYKDRYRKLCEECDDQALSLKSKAQRLEEALREIIEYTAGKPYHIAQQALKEVNRCTTKPKETS